MADGTVRMIVLVVEIEHDMARVSKRRGDGIDRAKARLWRREHGVRLTGKLARTQQHELEDQTARAESVD